MKTGLWHLTQALRNAEKSIFFYQTNSSLEELGKKGEFFLAITFSMHYCLIIDYGLSNSLKEVEKMLELHRLLEYEDKIGGLEILREIYLGTSVIWLKELKRKNLIDKLKKLEGADLTNFSHHLLQCKNETDNMKVLPYFLEMVDKFFKKPDQ